MIITRINNAYKIAQEEMTHIINTIKNKKMNYFQTLLILAFVLPLLTLSSCSKKEHETTIKKVEPISVEIMEIQSADQTSSISVSGNIQAEEEAKISTRMMGFIQNMNAEVGDYVKKGKVLVNISNSDLQAKLAQVKANIRQAEVGVQNAEKDFKRISKLFDQNSVTQKELDDITTHYNMAKAGLEAAKQMENEVNAQFKYTRITAPFSGTVTNKYANTGEIANPGMPLLTIAKTSNYQAVAMVPENYISQLKKGQNAKVLIKAFDSEINGTVEEVSVSSNNTGGQYIVKIDLDDHKHKLYAGMFSTITFESLENVQQQKILIPENSLITKGELKGIYTVGVNNNAILRWLRIGRKYENKYEVLSGLDIGDKIITSSNSRLYNGSPLIIQ